MLEMLEHRKNLLKLKLKLLVRYLLNMCFWFWKCFFFNQKKFKGLFLINFCFFANQNCNMMAQESHMTTSPCTKVGTWKQTLQLKHYLIWKLNYYSYIPESSLCHLDFWKWEWDWKWTFTLPFGFLARSSAGLQVRKVSGSKAATLSSGNLRKVPWPKIRCM